MFIDKKNLPPKHQLLEASKSDYHESQTKKISNDITIDIAIMSQNKTNCNTVSAEKYLSDENRDGNTTIILTPHQGTNQQYLQQMVVEWVNESGIDPQFVEKLWTDGHLSIPSVQNIVKYIFQKPEQPLWQKIKAAQELSGSWMVVGSDPFDLSKKSNFAQIKPHQKHREYKQQQENIKAAKEGRKPNTVAKYLSSFGIPTSVLIFPPATRESEKVTKNPLLPPGVEPNLARYASDPSIDLHVGEGAKKIAKLSSLGLFACGLAGVGMGMKRPNATDSRQLIPELDIFCQEGRQVYVPFDNDPKEKEKTKMNVNRELFNLCYAIHKKTKVKPKVPDWSQYAEKGIDDLMAAHGESAYYDAVQNAKVYTQREALHWNELYGEADIVENEKYLTYHPIPTDVVNAFIKAREGQGKTEIVSHLSKEYSELGYLILMPSHRQSLENANGKRLKLHTDDQIFNGVSIPGYLSGMSACVDSIRKMAFYLEQNEGVPYVVVIDEATQVFWHALTAETEIKNDRSGNLQKFQEILQNARLVIYLDSAINTTFKKFIEKIRPGKSLVWVNDYKSDREVTVWTDPAAMLYQGIVPSIAQGDKVYIPTQGQDFGSKYGTRNLEKILTGMFPNAKCLRMDADTIGDPNHPAYRAPERINEIIQEYQILITSNVIGTGISIDEGHGIDSEYAFCQGVGSPMDAIQQFQRPRGEIKNRNICVTGRGLSPVGNGSRNPKGLLAGYYKAEKHLFGALSNEGIEIEETSTLYEWEIYMAQWGAILNRANVDYGDWVVALLEDRGYKVKFNDAKAEKAEKVEIRDSADTAEVNFYTSSENAPEISEEDRAKLNEAKRSLTDSEKAIKLKANFKHHTGHKVKPTADLLKKYDKDRWLGKTKLHLYLLSTIFSPATEDAIAVEKAHRNRKHFRPETLKRTLSHKVALLKKIGLDKLLARFAPMSLSISKTVLSVLNQNTYDYTTQGQTSDTPQDLEDLQNENLVQAYQNITKIADNFLYIDQLHIENYPNLSDQDQAIAPSSNHHQNLWLTPADPLVVEVCANARKMASDCKDILGFTPAPKYDASLLKQLLRVVGLDMLTEGKSPNAKSCKYRIIGQDDGRVGYWEHLIERRSDYSYVLDQTEYFVDCARKSDSDIVTSLGREIKAGFDLAILEDGVTIERIASAGRMELARKSEIGETPTAEPTPTSKPKIEPIGKQLNVVDGLKLQTALERGEYTRLADKYQSAIAPNQTQPKPTDTPQLAQTRPDPVELVRSLITAGEGIPTVAIALAGMLDEELKRVRTELKEFGSFLWECRKYVVQPDLHNAEVVVVT